jgi:flagellar protein FliL
VTTDSARKQPPGKAKWPLLAALVALSVAGGWFFHSARSEAGVANAQRSLTTLHLDPFVVNLDDADGRSYLRVGIDLGVRGDAAVSPPTAALRDTIIGVLSRAKPEDLLSAEGKAKLKADLMASLQDRAPQLGVQEVYFTDFLVQR